MVKDIIKEEDILVINIKEQQNHLFVEAEENAVSAYTDWCLDNTTVVIDIIFVHLFMKDIVSLKNLKIDILFIILSSVGFGAVLFLFMQ
jgi:hypothetical protein